MADVNVNKRDSFMATPSLKSHAEDRKVCKKKNQSWLFGAYRKIRPSGSLFGITQAKQWPSGGFFYPHLTLMKDSYNVRCGWIKTFQMCLLPTTMVCNVHLLCIFACIFLLVTISMIDEATQSQRCHLSLVKRKPVFGDFVQGRHKPACAATETS